MAFDAAVPNGNQTVGEAIASANENDRSLKALQDAHVADVDAHGIAPLRTAAAASAAHQADESNPHGINSIRSVANAARDELALAKGQQSSLTARLAVSLRTDGGLRLDAVSSRWMSAGDSPSFLSAYSFSVPGDRLALFVPGALLRLTISGDYAYALVASRTFTAGITTVTLDPNGPTLAAGLSKVELGAISYDYAHAAAIGTLTNTVSALTAQVAALNRLSARDSYLPVLTASAVVAAANFAGNSLIPAGFAGSTAVASTPATASTVLTIKKGATNVGTLTFAAGASVGTFAMATDLALTGADILTVVAPATPDATLRYLAFDIKAIQQ